MKKLIVLTLCLMTLNQSAWAWARQGHATIAKIAENHLTPKAKKQIAKYLHGKSIVAYASYADDYKNKLPVDLGFEPTDWKRVTTYPHTFEANDDCTPYRGIERDGKYVKNCIYYIEKFAEDLRHPENLTDSARIMHIALIVHFVGDMHCPEHIRYPEDQTIGYYDVTFRGKPIRFHTLWDSQVLSIKHPWGFLDTAYLLDCCSPKEIEAITAGTPWDWGTDSARASRHVHEVKEGAVLGMDYILDNLALTESQIRNAGYRLAKLLNEIFG